MVRSATRLLAMAWLCSAISGAALAQGLSDVAARAAFAFNFAKYVEWRDGGDGELLLCVLSSDEAQLEAFVRLEGRALQGRTLRIVQPARPAESTRCQLLYVGRGIERRVMEGHLAAVRGNPVLTLSDIAGFLDSGGMVELVPRDERLTFLLDLGAIRRAGLRVSASAIRLANEVRER